MHHRVLSILLLVLVFQGCGQTEQGSVTKQELLLPKIELPKQEWTSPLTQGEIQSFATIVDHLPEQNVPDIATLTQPTANPDTSSTAKKFILSVRKNYRKALDMRALGESWERDEKLVQRFNGMNLKPEIFAALTTRISLAWAASAIRQEIPILATERKLHERLEFLAWRYDHPEIANLDPSERTHLALEIEQTVALSEFLNLLKTVPKESLQVVADNSEMLQKYLPKSTAASQFEQVIESSPKVIRVGHSAN